MTRPFPGPTGRELVTVLQLDLGFSWNSNFGAPHGAGEEGGREMGRSQAYIDQTEVTTGNEKEYSSAGGYGRGHGPPPQCH
jgi:hypothetical protein